MRPITREQRKLLKEHQRFLEVKECIASLHRRNVCTGKTVGAHIIPRAQLRQIAEDGHVHAVPARLYDIASMKRAGFKAEDVGIQNFSTLNCFCAHHDKTIFAPIEDVPLTFTREQLAVLHYRAIAAEVYVRRGREESAIVQKMECEESDPYHELFLTFELMHSDAGEAAMEALRRTELMLGSSNYDDIRAAIVRFDAAPILLSVCAFRPLYDVKGRHLQDYESDSKYLGMHILIAEGKPALAFTWLKGQKVAERLAFSFCHQPREQLTSLATQAAFEYAEHTCMNRAWWMGLSDGQRSSLLNRIEEAHYRVEVPDKRTLSYKIHYDDWDCRRIDFVG